MLLNCVSPVLSTVSQFETRPLANQTTHLKRRGCHCGGNTPWPDRVVKWITTLGLAPNSAGLHPEARTRLDYPKHGLPFEECFGLSGNGLHVGRAGRGQAG